MSARQEREQWRQVRRRWQNLRRLRQLIQYLALALFLYLFVRTMWEVASPIPVNLFARLDPLLALGSMLAARRTISTFAPAIITLLATLALGRFWCGWLCPLGTILDLFGPNVRKAIPQGLRQAKHFLLFIIIFAALLANLSLIFLDPVTILLRPLAGAIYPAIQPVIAASSQSQPLIQPILALPLVIILGLNLLAKRFWCRYLCPLGAFLGLVSKVAWLKRSVRENCVQCKQCVPECPMGIINEEDYSSDAGECIQCLDCLGRCPVGAIGFGGEWSLSWGYEYDPSRRQLLASLATGVVGVGLLNTDLLKSKNPYQLRPPGAKEEEFLTECVRCGRCIKVCPNSALHLALFEVGLEGIWTPILVPRLGYCDYSCNACGQVCPSGAIPPLSLEEKRKAVIGTAQVERERCTSCMICRDMCPTAAIEVVEAEKEGIMVMLPQVVPERCIGCGFCEYVCPVEGVAAIRVYAPGSLPSS